MLNRNQTFLKQSAAIKAFRGNRAARPDGIISEMIKAVEQQGVDIIYAICNKVWHSRIWSDDWVKSIFVAIHKREQKPTAATIK